MGLPKLIGLRVAVAVAVAGVVAGVVVVAGAVGMGVSRRACQWTIAQSRPDHK